MAYDEGNQSEQTSLISIHRLGSRMRRLATDTTGDEKRKNMGKIRMKQGVNVGATANHAVAACKPKAQCAGAVRWYARLSDNWKALTVCSGY